MDARRASQVPAVSGPGDAEPRRRYIFRHIGTRKSEDARDCNGRRKWSALYQGRRHAMGREECLACYSRGVPIADYLSVGAGVWERHQYLELYRILLATDEALPAQRRVGVYVLE